MSILERYPSSTRTSSLRRVLANEGTHLRPPRCSRDLPPVVLAHAGTHPLLPTCHSERSAHPTPSVVPVPTPPVFPAKSVPREHGSRNPSPSSPSRCPRARRGPIPIPSNLIPHLSHFARPRPTAKISLPKILLLCYHPPMNNTSTHAQRVGAVREPPVPRSNHPSFPPHRRTKPTRLPTFSETSRMPETNHLRHNLILSRLLKRVKRVNPHLSVIPNAAK